MPHLTETLLKSQGVRNPHKNLKKFINYNVTSYQNHKIRMPNTLGNRVSEQLPPKQEAVCRDEMLVMMACWKRNEFRENACSDEYKKFSKCMSQARAKVVQQQKFEDSDELGHFSQDGKMNAKQTNKLLRMYKQPPYKITLTHGAGIKQFKPIVFEQTSEDNTQGSIPKPLWGKPMNHKNKQNKSDK